MARRRRKPARRRKAGGGGVSWVWLAMLGVAVFAAGVYLGRDRTGGAPAESTVAAPAKPAPPRAKPQSAAPTPGEAEPAPASRGEPAPAPASGARVAIVIDDLGRSLQDLDTLDAFGIPLSYAVLPFESMTAKVAERIRTRRQELLLHLPMEPRGAQNPGPGALREGMGTEEIRRLTEEALAAVPGAVGVNNHMGSELSADRAAVRAILAVVAEHRLFFLDSRTSPESRGYAVAREMGIPAAERQVFLDTDPREEAVESEWNRLLALARERGAAIAIGHPHPRTLAVLAREVPRARRQGYEFVPVSYLLDSAGELPE